MLGLQGPEDVRGGLDAAEREDALLRKATLHAAPLDD